MDRPEAPPPGSPWPGSPQPWGASAQAPVRRNFVERHWKWMVPVGCLGVLVLVAGVALSITLFVFGMLKSSDAYRGALEITRQHPVARRELGEPMDPGLFVKGSVNVTGPSGSADLAIPISGPRGEGELFVVATKSAGRWQFSRLELELDGRPGRIDLLPSVP